MLVNHMTRPKWEPGLLPRPMYKECLVVEVTRILLVILPLAPGVEEKNKKLHSNSLALHLEACSPVM